MTLRIGSKAPDFTAKTTEGVIHFHDWIGDGWAVLCSVPKDSSPASTTELAGVASLKEQFEERSCKVLALSADRVKRKVAKAYGMLPPDANVYGEMGLVLDLERPAGRSDTEAASVRSVFVIGPDKRIKAMLTYPMSNGRDLDEVLRVVDSCQRAAKAREPSLRFALQPR